MELSALWHMSWCFLVGPSDAQSILCPAQCSGTLTTVYSITRLPASCILFGLVNGKRVSTLYLYLGPSPSGFQDTRSCQVLFTSLIYFPLSGLWAVRASLSIVIPTFFFLTLLPPPRSCSLIKLTSIKSFECAFHFLLGPCLIQLHITSSDLNNNKTKNKAIS